MSVVTCLGCNMPGEGVVLYQPTGSYYICDPPVKDSDRDILVLVENREEYHVHLEHDHFYITEEYPLLDGFFSSYRKDLFNIIVTDNPVWYLRYAAATELAKQMNILEKPNRIDLFHTILEGEKYLKNKEEL